MKETLSHTDVATSDRREFLKLASLGALAGGAASVVPDRAAAEPVTPGGYKESSHVKTYYDLARF